MSFVKDFQRKRTERLTACKNQYGEERAALQNELGKTVDPNDIKAIENKLNQLEIVIDKIGQMIDVSGNPENSPEPIGGGQHKAIHILTGTKGGIGKTLNGLAIVGDYKMCRRGNLAVVEMNTTNPDLYRLLCREQPEVIRTADGNGWNTFLVRQGIDLRIFASDKPYALFRGCPDFWRRINQIASHESVASFDVIVDTNLNVANIIDDSKESIEALRTLLSLHPDCVLYIWLLWTWNSIRDNGLIISALNLLNEIGNSRIRFIHVLNPGCLLPPNVDINKKIVRIQHILRLREELGEIITTELKDGLNSGGRGAQSDPIINRLNSITHQYEELIEQLLASLAPDPKDEYRIPGLSDLSKAHPVAYASHFQFQDHVSAYLPRAGVSQSLRQDFNPLYNSFQERFGGRPWNVLAISTHNPDLFGYTDLFIGRSLDSIIRDINPLVEDVNNLFDGINLLGF